MTAEVDAARCRPCPAPEAVPRRGGMVRSTSSTSTLREDELGVDAGDGAVQVDVVAGADVGSDTGHEVELDGHGVEALGDLEGADGLELDAGAGDLLVRLEPLGEGRAAELVEAAERAGHELARVDLLGAELVLGDQVVGQVSRR